MATRLRLTLALVALTLVSGCNQYLRLEILNATDAEIIVVINDESSSIRPGLSYSAKFPGSGSPIAIKSHACTRIYEIPKLDEKPWKFLIGDALKLRAMTSGALEAYPPTPDVELLDNPLRAMAPGQVALQPKSASCK
jgi:hypothetical protein